MKPFDHSYGIGPHHATSADLLRRLREKTDTVLLGFSAGKDAICSLHALREHGFRVVPYYLELVPGLEFVEDGLRKLERELSIDVIRLPSPSFFRMLKNLVFQPPDKAAAIEAVRFRTVTYADVYEHLRKHHCPNAPIAIGVRSADSPMRRMSIKTHGSMSSAGVFYPVFDWRIADVRDCLSQNGYNLPIDYEMFGRSFDGIDYRFLEPVARMFPRDYERILEWFPLASLELQRRSLCPRT